MTLCASEEDSEKVQQELEKSSLLFTELDNKTKLQAEKSSLENEILKQKLLEAPKMPENDELILAFTVLVENDEIPDDELQELD